MYLPPPPPILQISRVNANKADDLIEINRYLDHNIKYRLAFREFGTCLGVQCQSEQTSEKERAVDLKSFADAIITSWDPYMELTLGAPEMAADDLRPITRVMYASALIPGGEFFFLLLFFLSKLEAELMLMAMMLAFRNGYLGPEPQTTFDLEK